MIAFAAPAGAVFAQTPAGQSQPGADSISGSRKTGTRVQTLPTLEVAAPRRSQAATASGTKTATPLIETPQAVSVITSRQIEVQNAQTMEAVLRYSAGVRAEMYGPDNRGDWFTLRGGSEGSTVLDGLRLPLSGWYGNVRNEPYAFDRVEVLRGPASVLYGQNGPGGVVNLVSKLPQANAHREIGVQLGNRSHKQLGLDATGATCIDRGDCWYGNRRTVAVKATYRF